MAVHILITSELHKPCIPDNLHETLHLTKKILFIMAVLHCTVCTVYTKGSIQNKHGYFLWSGVRCFLQSRRVVMSHIIIHILVLLKALSDWLHITE